jgi:transcriptional regulator with XRE-family HTH domain
VTNILRFFVFNAPNFTNLVKPYYKRIHFIPMIAAKHLKDLRLKNSYTQQYLATELGVSQKTYSNLENGIAKITLEHLINMATVYKMEVVDLTAQLTNSSPVFMTELKEQHKESSSYDLYNGVNADLTLELLASYKAQIDNLIKLNAVLEERVRDLAIGL